MEELDLEVGEALKVVDRIDRKYGLMARIQYGGVLRLMEHVRLRVNDVDETCGIIKIHGGKGDKDRTTVLPQGLRGEIWAHKEQLRKVHEADRASGLAGAWLREALLRKHPRGWEKWPIFFPSSQAGAGSAERFDASAS